jgi:hypothetical protein
MIAISRGNGLGNGRQIHFGKESDADSDDDTSENHLFRKDSQTAMYLVIMEAPVYISIEAFVTGRGGEPTGEKPPPLKNGCWLRSKKEESFGEGKNCW